MLRAPFMTIQDVAELLKVSKATVRTWIKNEELRAVKFEREFRIAKVDLERFVEARATMAAPETAAPPDRNATTADP
ncbi:MAG: helix-turn-helix domain-containing protein [Rhodospirillaceae bacterium]